MSQNTPDSAAALRRMPMKRMCLTPVAAFFLGSPFWTLATSAFNASGAAVMLNLIKTRARRAGCLGNHTTARLRSHGLGDGTGSLFFASVCFLGFVVPSLVGLSDGAAAPLTRPQSQASGNKL